MKGILRLKTGLTFSANLLKRCGQDGVEPPDASLFRATINGPNYPSINNLTRQDADLL